MSVFASFKSNRVAISFRAWFKALSISCLSTSETKSNEGIRELRIVFGNSNIAVLGFDLNFRLLCAIDQNVNLFRKLRPALLFVLEIVGDFAGTGAGDQMKCSFFRQISERIPIINCSADRENALLPPFIDKRDVSSFDSDVQRAEAIVDK